MPERLAIHGGTPVIAPDLIRAWPPVDELDARYILASLRGGRYAYGPNCQAFEQEFAIWNGNRFAVATNSGTAALHMCVAACGCLEGDEIIVPAYSWSSSATCVLLHNCIPIFVDIDWETMNIDVGQIEAAITPKTKAILVVHLHGLAVDMDAVMAIAERHGLKVIEDVCQAHGARFHDRTTGTLGHCAAFSFNQHKNLCTGEGGMFVTDDEEMMRTARRLWSFGEAATPAETRDYHVYSIGWMYRMNDLTAAFGRAQLTRLEMYLEWQERSVPLLTRRLAEVPHLLLPAEPAGHEHTFYNYVIRFDFDAMGHAHDARALRDKLARALAAEGVQASVWQRCILPAMTIFQSRNAYGYGTPWSSPHARPVNYHLAQYPVAQRHCDTHICLGETIRYPNGSDVIELIAAGFAKVMGNLKEVGEITLD
jgi:dTDP-4-amino-4,6-dideoxygalactose transaminase